MKNNLFRSTLLLYAFLVFLLPAYSQEPFGKATQSTLVYKNFPLAWHLQKDSKVRKAIRKDPKLAAIALENSKELKDALDCSSVPNCYSQAIKVGNAEQVAVADELVRLYSREESIRKMTAKLRQDGSYALYDSLPDTAMLRRAVLDMFAGTNRIVDVYLLGVKPQYPRIDSIAFTRGDKSFYNEVRSGLSMIAKNRSKYFYDAPLSAAMKLLEINKRDEGARYEPLAKGLNDGPSGKVLVTKWEDYKYSLILIPGLGPETPGVALDPGAISRCDAGAARYREGAAPFIVVSGGNVHPFMTPFNEAVEMKKYLVETLKIPEDVVFIEPHARHTTTNLRNTNRMIFRFGIPVEKPVLIVSDANQTTYISGNMGKTAIRDLQYIPYKSIRKLSETETEYLPNRTSLHSDPNDPLDP